MRRIVQLSAIVALGALPTLASARVDIFVHGRNSGSADVSNYWTTSPKTVWPGAINSTGANDGASAFSGGANGEGTYAYGYDASKSYSNLADNSMPGCQFNQAVWYAPGIDFAVISHSAGGPVVSYMLAWAHHPEWGLTGCAYQPKDIVGYITYFIPVAAPFRGTTVADAIYGNSSGNWAQYACGTAAGFFANLVFNQASDMTWALQESQITGTWFNSLTAYAFSAVYQQGGTSTNGDDSTGLRWAQYCANVEGGSGWATFSPNAPAHNDGFISQNSANGCGRGTAWGTNCMPGGHVGWFDSVSHSSNRRNDTQSFAVNVWNRNPY